MTSPRTPISPASPTFSTASSGPQSRLSEDAIILGFHSILKDSLAQARAEGVLTDDELETGDTDVQIAGPALDLASHERHDVSLIICDKEPLSSPIVTRVVQLAGDIKSIALEITQRRTFQMRYASDLEHALNSGVRPRKSGESDRRSQYLAPPEYGDARAKAALEHGNLDHAPSLSQEQQDNLAVIRETLYSALADCLVTNPGLVATFALGPAYASRAFFASTCLAILEVCLTRVDSEGVRAVNLGRNTPRVIGLRETPEYLRPFLGKLLEVSGAAKSMEEEDDVRAMQAAAEDRDAGTPRLQKLRLRLEKGVESRTEGESSDETQGSEVGILANAINELALGMANLPAFRDRQAEAFKVLVGVKSF